MFIQIIQGTCRDADALHRQLDRWRQEMGPKAEGWLGGTYGVTDGRRHHRDEAGRLIHPDGRLSYRGCCTRR